MTRLEELTANLADDLLTNAEARELDVLLVESDPARETYLRLLEVEAALRASRQNPDLVGSTMARLHRQMADAVAHDVMSEIRAQPMPEWGRRPQASKEVRRGRSLRFSRQAPSWRPPVAGWLALAACLVLVAGLGIWFFGPTMGEPVLAELHGTGLSLERAGQLMPANIGMRLQPGDVLRTPSTVTAVMGFVPEATRVTLQPGAELTLAEMSHGKHFDLRVGKIAASVARQRAFHPMTLTTPQAEARVVGTRFTLSATNNATRLEVTEGRVRLTRLSDGREVKVGAGHYAVVADKTELAALPFSGSIRREWWSGIRFGGSRGINALRGDPRYPGKPDGSDLSPALELQPLQTNHLGFRFCGYVHPPVTGDYEFWLAGAAGATLFMSPDENPADGVAIAGTAADIRTLDLPRFQGPSAWSGALPLVAGRRYYVEALVCIENGEIHLSVAWKRPGKPREPLTGEFLSPFKTKEKAITP